MNVLDQALNVVQRTAAIEGTVTLTLDLDLPEHRAALAAALAVLRAMGEDGEPLLSSGATTPADAAPAGTAGAPPEAAPQTEESPEAGAADDTSLRQGYSEAVAELTPDTERQARIVQETFPRIRELLRDGANVAAVAQIQYRRWVEENPGTPGTSGQRSTS